MEYIGNVRQTADGGYILIGTSMSNDFDVGGNYGEEDFWVVKLDAAGSMDWEKHYGGSLDDWAQDIIGTSDGGYIMVGWTESFDHDVSANYGGEDYWVVKLDVSGNIEWEQNYGGSANDVGRAIRQTNDGGYIVAGYSSSNDHDVSDNYGSSDLWLVKIDSTGNIEWEQNYGGLAAEKIYFSPLEITSDGGYIIAGSSLTHDHKDIPNNYGEWDYWAIKVDASGAIEWSQTFGGNESDYCRAVTQTANGGYILSGNTLSHSDDVSNYYGNSDYWVVKLDADGNMEWESNYGTSGLDIGTQVIQTPDGNYKVMGWAGPADHDMSTCNGISDYWLLNLSPNGSIISERNFGGSSFDEGVTLSQTSDGGFIVGGHAQSSDQDVSGNNGLLDFWVLKLDKSVGLEDGLSGNHMELYPNPTKGVLSVDLGEHYSKGEVLVTNAIGQMIQKIVFHNAQVLDLEITGASGLYFIQIHADGRQSTTLKAIKF